MAWSSLALFATFALALGLVIAIPVDPSFPVARGLNKSNDLETRMLKFPVIKIAKESTKWATQAQFKTAFAKAAYEKKVFWSGNRMAGTKRTSILAEVVAKIKPESKWTIEMALEAEKLVMPPFDLKMQADGSDVWKEAMDIWAKGAKGDVEVYQGELREGNAYEEFEKPVLKALLTKGTVTKVAVHDLIEGKTKPFTKVSL